ncbi:MAG: OmpH family outer membrane protein [Pirellulaceae bacterium]
MRRSIFVATLVACTSLLSVGSVSAQVTGAASTAQSPSVVVIDIEAVFKEHLRFKQSIEIMKKDVADFENFVRDKQTEIRNLGEQIKQFNPGTPDYRNIEERAAQLTSDLQVKMQLKRREFMEQEAKLYYTVYTEVKGLVARFANKQGISLVLRYNSQDIDPTDRTSVMMGVQSPIVFQRNLDITGLIIDEANRGTPPTDTIGRPQLPTRPR